ncbi:MAG: FkbM family methyltransferase [Methylobacter sp.]
MSFVSYAQNFEDVMLWRALKHVQNGVYVDVGAQHPIVDSVSKAFYEHGWRGVHIEPVSYYANLLRQDRPDEVVLEVALSDIEGTLELNVIAETGLSTAVDAYAHRHHIERGYDSQRIQVPVLTLKSALRSLEGKDVHWLKIDVEGLEEKVLKGWDSRTFRPWVMVVEATIPNSPEVDYVNWNPILTAADYQFVYFDGLNRFFVAKEHAELAEAFSCPPNVFDEVVLSGLASWGLCSRVIASHQEKEKELGAQTEVKVQQAEAETLQAEARAAHAEAETRQAEARAAFAEAQAQQAEVKSQQLHDRLIAVHQSTSWYATKPLRAVKRLSGGDFLPIREVIQEVKLVVKKTLRPPLAALIKIFFDNEKMRACLSPWFKRIPWLHQRLLRVGVNTGVVPPLAQNMVKPPQFNQRQEPTFPEGLSNLNPRARRIYLDLNAAIDNRDKENGKCV